MIGVMSDEDAAAKALARAPRSVSAKPIQFKPRPEVIRDMVWRLAADTDNIKWSKHALERMAERGITDKFALDAMRHGSLKGGVEAGQKTGEWKVKMTHRAKGRREVGVVVITVCDNCLLVKTVEWEDLT